MPPEKKTLKVDFPLEDVPFPVKNAVSTTFPISGQNIAANTPESKIEVPSKPFGREINLSEPPEFAENFSVQTESSDASNEFPVIEKSGKVIENSSEFQISNFKFQVRDDAEIQNFNNRNHSEMQNGNPKRDFESQKSSGNIEQNPQISSPKFRDLITSMPVKMIRILSEELEHFDDDKLDTAFQNKLARLGDNLFPIKNAAKIVEELTGVTESNGFGHFPENQNGSATAAAPAKAKPVFEMPNFDTDDDSEELPVLSENPSPEEMLAYAQKHPAVKKVIRAFRGKIVEVKRIQR